MMMRLLAAQLCVFKSAPHREILTKYSQLTYTCRIPLCYSFLRRALLFHLWLFWY